MVNKKVRSLLKSYEAAQAEKSDGYCDACFSKGNTITVKYQLPEATTEIVGKKEVVKEGYKMNVWQIEDIVIPLTVKEWGLDRFKELPKMRQGVNLPCMKCGEMRFLALNTSAYPRFMIDYEQGWEEWFIVKRGGKENCEFVNLVPWKDQ